VFPNDAEFARFAVALTCFTNGADKALIVFPERRRLSVPAAVALGSQRSGTSGPATTVELTAVDRSLDNNPTEVDVEGVVSIGRISLSGPDAGDFEIVRALGGRCGDRSEASALRCLPQVRFAPRTPGAKQATLVIESDGYRAPGAPPHSVALTGTATGALASAPASLALGDVAVGGSSRATLTVTNTGNEALAIDELTLENAGAGWSVASGTCAATVAPGASCAAQVTYAPAATGAASASVRVVSDSVGAAPVVALSARGVASGVTAAPLALGPVAVGDSASATAQIVNTGNVALQISSVAAAGPDAARVSVDAVGCAGASVAPGAGCDIEVTVAPQARGALDAELRVLSNAPSSPNVVALSATGVQGVAEGPEAVALGSVRVGSFAEAEVELSNDGDAPLTLGSLAVEGAAELVADACSEATMAVGEECAATVRFTPTAPGALDARLRVPNDGEGGERIVELTGTGLPEEEPGGEAPGGREPGGGDAGGREPGGGDPGGGDPGGGDPGGREPGGGNPGGGDGGGGDLGGGGPGGGGPGGGGAGGDGALRGGGDAGRGGERPPGGSAGDAGKARLKLIAPARATVRRGRTVRLRIGVRNAGQRAAAATGLSLRLPASLRWLPPRRAGRGASMAARTVDLRVGRLAAGSARAFTVTVRAQPRARRGVVALVLRAEGAGGATATTALRIR
jgi:hypothetical protein